MRGSEKSKIAAFLLIPSNVNMLTSNIVVQYILLGILWYEESIPGIIFTLKHMCNHKN